jgi:carboxymethylenebutenolidase
LVQSGTPIIATEGGREFNSFFSRPSEGRGPGIIILSEMWGLGDPKRVQAALFAEKGWCVLVPNMFWRSADTGVVPFDQADKAWARLDAFDFDQSAHDVRTAALWLRQQPNCNGHVGAIGFCVGGRLAFIAASRVPEIEAASALYALNIAMHLDEVRAIQRPIQMHYALNDQHVPVSEIDAVEAAAKGNPNVEILKYPGVGHAFFSIGRPTHDEAASAKAMAAMERLFEPLK